MPDILLRGFSDEDMDRMAQAAQAAGQDRMNWAKGLLVAAASGPLTRKRYAYRGLAENGASFTLRRLDDGPKGVHGGADRCDQAQIDADRQARLLFARNEPGDRERGLGLLRDAGFEIFEIAV